MNIKQKILSGVFLIMFWVSCLHVPWHLSGGERNFDTLERSPIFRPPAGGTWTKREISPTVKYSWGFLAISYALLFGILSENKKKDN